MAGPKVVDATPVKSFFVEMLTRDISLDDAILDLMDNSVDGVMRVIGKSSLIGEESPYSGYWVKISLDHKKFVIEDNCGGIPLDVLVEYAFRMGRSPSFKDKPVPTVGTFGIGMKRAIFKMGRDCSVLTYTGRLKGDGNNSWKEVRITPDWIDEPDRWDIPMRGVEDGKGLRDPGTKIVIRELTQATSREFGGTKPALLDRLVRTISETYALIIAKGFKVYVNDALVKPRPMVLMMSEKFKPYFYLKDAGNVKIQLMVGLTGPLQTEKEREIGEPVKNSSANAGWTVVCNDRVVLYCDKTTQTGWGELPVPKFHNQFIQISGIVYFESEDARLLPTTTTKRGVDANNPLYQEVKNRMREGTKRFTDFTNKWKGKEGDIRSQLEAVPRVQMNQLRKEFIKEIKLNRRETARAQTDGVVRQATYPIPPRVSRPNNRFVVTIEPEHIPDVESFLGLLGRPPEYVIESAFDYVYKKGTRK